jgi:hypothetical protein
MEQEKAIKLLLRQIKDIQAQADKIVTGENSIEAIENFARYSSELKDYIAKNVKSQEIVIYLNDLPDVNYTRSQIKLWQYLILPSWWITLYKDYQAKNRTIQEIGHVRGKYATLELLVKGLSE